MTTRPNFGIEAQLTPEHGATEPAEQAEPTEHFIKIRQAEQSGEVGTSSTTITDEAVAQTVIASQPVKTKKRRRKQLLVSCSSQDSNSSQDKTSPRRCGRKPTAVPKMRGVMVDHNLRKKSKEERKKYPKQNNHNVKNRAHGESLSYSNCPKTQSQYH